MFYSWLVDDDAGALMDRRRFPPPWSVREQAACYIVRDSSGQTLGYFFYEEAPDQRSAAKTLTRDEARRIAVNFAKLPELLSRYGYFDFIFF